MKLGDKDTKVKKGPGQLSDKRAIELLRILEFYKIPHFEIGSDGIFETFYEIVFKPKEPVMHIDARDVEGKTVGISLMVSKIESISVKPGENVIMFRSTRDKKVVTENKFYLSYIDYSDFCDRFCLDKNISMIIWENK